MQCWLQGEEIRENMAAERIRNDEWINDLALKDDLTEYVKRNWRKKEILDFIRTKYPMYAWSERTLSRRLQYFDIRFIDYNVSVDAVEGAVRRELEGPGQLLGYRAMQQKLREVHGLCVPRDLVYAVMGNLCPQTLEARGGVGKAKRPKRNTSFATGVCILLKIET